MQASILQNSIYHRQRTRAVFDEGMQDAISNLLSSSSEKQQKALDRINVRGPVVKCWVLQYFPLNEGLIHCQYCCKMVLLSNAKQFYGGCNFIQFLSQIQHIITFICTRGFKESLPSKSRPSASYIILLACLLL